MTVAVFALPALATLGNATRIETILFVLDHSRWTGQVGPLPLHGV
jgi:hypothetical protein